MGGHMLVALEQHRHRRASRYRGTCTRRANLRSASWPVPGPSRVCSHEPAIGDEHRCASAPGLGRDPLDGELIGWRSVNDPGRHHLDHRIPPVLIGVDDGAVGVQGTRSPSASRKGD